ncbi:MAG TPA: cupin domain-containing protein [Solirubrobacteraceae bacterium]|nr:cupin domain-containing protein [Solirubrobacteraceae bacterium]
MSVTTTPAAIGAGEGTVELSFGRPMFKIGAPQGATWLGLIDATVPPGGGFRVPHWHDDIEEAFYVLAGKVEYLLGDTWITARTGGTVFIPAGCIHAFRNDTSHTARMLVIGSSPEMLELIRELGTSPRERWEDVCARYRTHLASDSPHFPATAAG